MTEPLASSAAFQILPVNVLAFSGSQVISHLKKRLLLAWGILNTRKHALKVRLWEKEAKDLPKDMR